MSKTLIRKSKVLSKNSKKAALIEKKKKLMKQKVKLNKKASARLSSKTKLITVPSRKSKPISKDTIKHKSKKIKAASQKKGVHAKQANINTKKPKTN